MKNRKVKKWVLLMSTAAALLFIPRRSSQKAGTKSYSKTTERKNDKKIAEHD